MHKVENHAHDARVLVRDDDASGSEPIASFFEIGEVEGRIELIGRHKHR